MSRAENLRKKELAAIHLGKKQLGLDDELYRDMLEDLTGKRSAGDMTQAERRKVLDEMRKDTGGKVYKPSTRVKTEPGREPMLKKVYALLYARDRPLSYGIATLKQMFGNDAPDNLAWANGEQLHKLIAALEYQKKREGK